MLIEERECYVMLLHKMKMLFFSTTLFAWFMYFLTNCISYIELYIHVFRFFFQDLAAQCETTHAQHKAEATGGLGTVPEFNIPCTLIFNSGLTFNCLTDWSYS